MVVVVVEPGAEKASEQLTQELALVGLNTETVPGTSPELRDALQEGSGAAVVHLRKDGAEIWVFKEEGTTSARKSVEVKRNEGETSEHWALRTTEVLHGQLLPGETKDDKRPRDRASAGGAFSDGGRRLSITSGPTILVRTFGTAALGWTVDGSVWLGRWGFGPFLTVGLTSSRWIGTPEPFIFRDLVAGGQGRLLLVEDQNARLDAQAIARVGFRSLSLREETGPPAERFVGGATMFSSEGGVEGSYRCTPWLSAGAQLLGGIDLPLGWPQTTSESPRPKPKKGETTPGAQGHLTAGVVATLFW